MLDLSHEEGRDGAKDQLLLPVSLEMLIDQSVVCYLQYAVWQSDETNFNRIAGKDKQRPLWQKS